MSYVCEICGKSPRFGKSVSHSQVATNRRFRPNIQTVRGGRGNRKMHVCAACIRAGKVKTTSPTR